MQTKDTKSYKFEEKISNNISIWLKQQNIKFLEAAKYIDSDNKYYSDIFIRNKENDKRIWIEVKENKYSCLGNFSMKYKDGRWTCTTTDEDNNLTEFYENAITKGSEKFISFCKEYLKTDDISIPKDLTPELIEAWKKSGSVDDTDNDVQFITDKIPLEGFGEKIAEYYKTAKYEPVYYMQVDDELYIIDSQYNPLGLKTRNGHELKTLADAYRIGRIQFRAKGIEKKLKDETKYYYSIVCDVKILANKDKEEDEYKCSFKSEENWPIVSLESGDNEKMTVNEDVKKLFERSARVLLEDWLPEYDNKPVNQWGEKWINLKSSDGMFCAVEEIVRDCQADPDEDHKEDSLILSSIHRTEEGHYIVTVFGGCNGGGSSRKIITYLAVVKKFAKKLIERFGHVWLIDWSNDCADDVWTVRLAFSDINDKAGEEERDEIYTKLIELYNEEGTSNKETTETLSFNKADADIGGEKSDSIPQTGVKIWIDDIREAPQGFKWIKSVNEFIDYCCENGVGNITLYDTDHDAGDYQKDGGDYIKCFDYLEACGCDNITIHIHSANPVGANNIRRIITRNKENGWKEIRNS